MITHGILYKISEFPAFYTLPENGLGPGKLNGGLTSHFLHSVLDHTLAYWRIVRQMMRWRSASHPGYSTGSGPWFGLWLVSRWSTIRGLSPDCWKRNSHRDDGAWSPSCECLLHHLLCNPIESGPFPINHQRSERRPRWGSSKVART